jgi:hypothetical protein
MGIQYQFFEVVLVTFLLSCFAADARAQQSSQQQDLPTLSPPIDAPLSRSDVCELHRAPMEPRLSSSSRG